MWQKRLIKKADVLIHDNNSNYIECIDRLSNKDLLLFIESNYLLWNYFSLKYHVYTVDEAKIKSHDENTKLIQYFDDRYCTYEHITNNYSQYESKGLSWWQVSDMARLFLKDIYNAEITYQFNFIKNQIEQFYQMSPSEKDNFLTKQFTLKNKIK